MVNLQEFLHDAAISHRLYLYQVVNVAFQLFSALLYDLSFVGVHLRIIQRPGYGPALWQHSILEHHDQDAVQLGEVLELAVDCPFLTQQVDVDNELDIVVSLAVLFE